MRNPRLFLAALLLATLGFSGCGQPADDKATARNQDQYDSWSGEVAAKLPPDDLRVLREAQQEIKLYIMGHTSASGSEAISNAFLLKVDGLTVHQIMVQGLQDRIKRLTAAHKEAKDLYDTNSKIKTAPRDDDSARYLAGRVEEDRSRMEKTGTDLAATQADLDRINK